MNNSTTSPKLANMTISRKNNFNKNYNTKLESKIKLTYIPRALESKKLNYDCIKKQ
jgi:hypothetical protein